MCVQQKVLYLDMIGLFGGVAVTYLCYAVYDSWIHTDRENDADLNTAVLQKKNRK